MNFSTTFKFIEMHLYMQAPKNCLQALDSVYHGALRLITKSLTHKITKTLLIIVYYTFMLDGRCSVNLSYRQILLPPIKTVVEQFDNEKFYLLNYVLLMYTPTTTLKLPLQ